MLRRAEKNADKDLIEAFFAGNFLPFYERYLSKLTPEGRLYKTNCPFHDDKNPSFKIHPENGDYRRYHCYSCRESGDIFDFYGKKNGLDVVKDFPKVLAGIAADFGIETTKPRKAAVIPFDKSKIPFKHYKLGMPKHKYHYQDASGETKYYNCRFEPKDFRQCAPDGLTWSLKNIKKLPYNLVRVLAADTVYIVEGEKDVGTLYKINLVGSCNSGGAKNWSDELNKHFKDKKIILIPDNEQTGREHMQDVAEKLSGICASMKLIELPGLAPGGDVTDFLKAFDPTEAAQRLAVLVEAAAEYEPFKELLKKNKAKSQKKKIVVIDKFSPRPWALELCEKYQLRFDLQKRLWIYDSKSGLWSENAETIIEVELRKNLLGAELLKKYYITEIIADVRSLVFTQDEKHEPPLELIPFNNIIYNLKTDEQLKYDPKYFFTSKLAVNFNPNATCPFIDKIFSQLVYDPIDLYELISYCFYRGYVFAKWFFLWGSGGNGKTVFTTILERLIGKHNIRSITAEQLMDNRFAVADLHSKFANLAGEMSYNTLEKTAILKQLVGGDLLRGERKYREPFYFNNFAKLIFNTNSLPKTNDKTRAFYRRLYLIEFPNRFEGSDKEDKLLFQKITQEEIEGLAIKCLGYLMDLFDRGFFFTNDQSVDDLTKKYERLTNPLITFLDETTQRDLNDAIPKWQLRDLFTQWLSDKSFRIWNATQIGKEMKMLGYEDGRQNFDGSTQRCWFGLKWSEGE